MSSDLGTRNLGDGSIGGAMITSGIGECSPEMNAHLEGCLATEASMVVLDTLELIVQVFNHFIYNVLTQMLFSPFCVVMFHNC